MFRCAKDNYLQLPLFANTLAVFFKLFRDRFCKVVLFNVC